MPDVRNTAGVPKSFMGFSWSKILDTMVGSSVAQGDITYRGASTWDRLAAGTSGLFLTGRGASANPAYGPIAYGAGGMALRGSNTVTGAAATSLTVSGLDLNSDLRYWVEMEIVGVSGVPDLTFTYNSDTTAANYYVQGFSSSGSGSAGGRSNTAVIQYPLSSTTTSFDGVIRNNLETKPRMMYEVSSASAGSVIRGHGVHTWQTASTNVTSLTITTTVASSLGIGTSIYVYC